MRVIIFNDVQNFNASLDLINENLQYDKKRFWNYKKYIPFLIKKLKSLDKFQNEKLNLVKVFFYDGRYNSNLMTNFKWSANQEIGTINRMINDEQNLLNLISQQSNISHMIRKKVSNHVEEIRINLEKEKNRYLGYIEKQERNFEGQKILFKDLENNPLINIKTTPLKQSRGEIYQKGVDVLLAIDLVQLAHNKEYDLALVLSGDTDLIEAVKLIKSLGKNVVIFSYHTPGNPKKSKISDLMNVADFINLKDLNSEEIEEMSELRISKGLVENL